MEKRLVPGMSGRAELSELELSKWISPIKYGVCSQMWWLGGGLGALCLEDRRFKSYSSRHIRTLGKSFIRSCL